MIKQGFSIGDRDWYIMAYYDLKTRKDYSEAEDALIACGQKPAYAQKVISELLNDNTGYTYTRFGEHLTLILVSHATSFEQLYDTIQHEARHATDHIGSYYGIKARGEESAYLQGEIARNMYKAVAMLICPKCNNEIGNGYKKHQERWP